MKPTVALVGRPNVGKSTLFNRLTRSRDALVADQPGLTRDRHYGQGRVGEKPYLVVDTGGFEPVVDEGILFEMAKQTLQAVDEADAVVFLVDGRAGLTPQDKIIANRLRQLDRPVFLAVNKAEGMKHAIAGAEFHELALGEPLVVSAAHGDGVRELMELVLEGFPDEVEEEDSRHPKFAVIGRPNVGKSTLVNAILGEERVIAFDQAGTTRDSIYIDFEREGHTYTIIDTAGVRRRAKVNEMLEKFSVIKTMKAIEDANVAVLVLDAQLDISEQDATIAGFALEAGRALVVAVNKWDNLDGEQKENVRREIARKLNFLDFAKFHYISAIEGRGVADLFKSIDEAYRAAMAKLATPKLTRVLQVALERQQPPRAGLIRPKMRYAHQGGQNPPIIVVHGNALDNIPASYTRYLEHTFRKVFKLQGTPLRVQYKSSDNPFDNDEKDKPRAKAKPMSKMRGREKEVRYGKNSKK
ncbi:ribosome biogenesis GTPase Der [Chromobacterium sp. ATCC 53434]|uniref:ribosome biogenesis GTPase Der n=1 Tax=Chromobacterium TaxID=535 RepID=UPI000C775F10|nr:ribosome biogenesis GTPase Der [Chromobacterium sp. ATCC 53434]AUH50001.1 ribosome biogenesis GTPase Der [Chromobacterium sp. ATCC 53434]